MKKKIVALMLSSLLLSTVFIPASAPTDTSISTCEFIFDDIPEGY